MGAGPMLLRVSSRRSGTLPVKPGELPPVNHPEMSTMRCASLSENTHTDPSGPIGATTPFATVPPRTKLTFEASGRAVPQGHTVAYPASPASAMVTLRATAVASAGTAWAAPFTVSVTPRTGTARGVLGVMRPVGPPIALRVSTRRRGTAPTNGGVPAPPPNQPSTSTRMSVCWFE